MLIDQTETSNVQHIARFIADKCQDDAAIPDGLHLHEMASGCVCTAPAGIPVARRRQFCSISHSEHALSEIQSISMCQSNSKCLAPGAFKTPVILHLHMEAGKALCLTSLVSSHISDLCVCASVVLELLECAGSKANTDLLTESAEAKKSKVCKLFEKERGRERDRADVSKWTTWIALSLTNVA